MTDERNQGIAESVEALLPELSQNDSDSGV
jgi:hypothetical protein